MAIEDILIGPMAVKRAPVGEANPDETTIAYGDAWGGNWEDLGFSSEDAVLTMNVEEEVVEAMAQQATRPLKRQRTNIVERFETTLIEITGDNLEEALNGTVTDTPAGVGQVGFTSIKVGDAYLLDEYKYGFEGFRVDSSGVKRAVRIFVHRATGRIGGALEFGKATVTGIPLLIESLHDDSQPAGEEAYEIQIVTAPAT